MTRDRHYRLKIEATLVDDRMIVTADQALLLATLMRRARLARCSRSGRKNARVYRFAPRNHQEQFKRTGVLG